jgi:HSP20 family protein
MKINSYLSAQWVAVALTSSGLLVSMPSSASAETKKDDKGFLEKMEQWQNKMSEKFRDTWNNLRGDAKGKSVSTASVDVREDTNNYTVRLDLPGRVLEKVNITLDGDTLRIVVPADDKAARYEQSLGLTNVASGAEPKIARNQKDGMIVVTVPKSSGAEAKPSRTLPDPALSPLSDWDRDIFARMEKMRRDMDRAFEDAFREFGGSVEHKGFFDEPRFGSSLDLKEDGENYVVRVYLPDRDVQDVDVTVEDRTLKIAAREAETTKKEEKTGTLHSTRKAAYAQVLTLPGPVQSDKMQVEKKEEMVIVTIPKRK